MNAFTVSNILITLSCLSMSIFVLIKGRSNPSNKYFAYTLLAVIIWSLSGIVISRTTEYELSHLAWQFAYTGVILVPMLFFRFIYAYFELRDQLTLKILYGLTLLFLTINIFCPAYFWGDITFKFNEFYFAEWITRKSFLYLIWYFVFYWLLILYSFRIILKTLKFADGNRKIQIKYFFLALVIAWIGPELVFLPTFSIDIYPYSNFLIAIFPLIMVYAIVKHQLLDINIVVRRTITYSLLITIISLIYVILIFFMERTLRKVIGYDSLILAIIFISLFSVLFTPLKNKVQMIVDRFCFKGTISQIDEENYRLREELQKTEQLKAVATLAAGMAHEIKNPLTSIKTFTEYVDRKKDDPKFMAKFKTIVGSEIDKINYIVKQLLEFSRPSDLNLKESDINTLLDETLDLLNNDFLKKNIKVCKHYTNLPLINVDPSQMKQVFLNLFLNAIDAMPTGGSITIRTNTNNAINPINATNTINNPRHTKYDIRNTNTVAITISDTGYGIAKVDLKHIFDPFFTKKEGGTGLGLSVVHGIIEKHNGRIHASSQLNTGTTFSITLPTIQ